MAYKTYEGGREAYKQKQGERRAWENDEYLVRWREIFGDFMEEGRQENRARYWHGNGVRDDWAGT